MIVNTQRITHCLNKSLPKPESQNLQDDEANNLNEISICLDKLTNVMKGALDTLVVNKLYKLLSFRKSLKLFSADSFLVRVLEVVHQVYISRPATVSVKSVLLQILNDVCSIRKHKTQLKFEGYDYRLFWDQAISIVTRARKIESISSGEVLVEHLSKLCSFTYSCRRFVSENDAARIIEEAMEKLSDTRQSSCVEGLIMLVNCLPSYYCDYDSILPKWLGLWRSINFSPAWDVCWLTLFVRARYHTKTFDWNSLIGWLLIKTKELLILPNNEPIHSDKMYRMEFQKYYLNMLPFANQYRKLALCKIARLLYFCTVIFPSSSMVTAYPISITPPNLSEDCLFSVSNAVYPGFNDVNGTEINAYANELGMFFQTLRHFLYASNSGNWTQNLSIFIMYMIGEMSKHVGVSFIQNVLEFSSDIKLTLEQKRLTHFQKENVKMQPIHIPTIKYLCGLLTTVSIEGLFGKDHASSFAYGSNLKNLICIDPQLGHIIMPFLLSTLTAVNQSHQAPIALHAITLCYRPLLYPVPVILSYLPELLQNLLPGLDPSDRMKSFMTLHLIATILAWTPVQSRYTATAEQTGSQSYFSMIEAANAAAATPSLLIKETMSLQTQFDNLSTAWQTWIPSFLDRYFLLLEAREAKPQGRGPQDSKGSGALCEAIGYLFQAISYTKEPELRQLVETKVLEYFKRSSPINAAKICGKMFEYMTVSSHGANLRTTLDTFLDKDTATVGSISSDKLAFRLRLICGAVRECNGRALVLLIGQLSPFTETTFTHHTEKPVRKAAHKLLKDLLKGLTSIYPLTVSPSMASEAFSVEPAGGSYVVGEPVSLKGIEWHIPSKESLTVAVQLLRSKSSSIMQNVSSIFETILDPTADESSKVGPSGVTGKKQDDSSKIEDTIAYSLKMLTKLLRGAAEILGDELSDGVLSNADMLADQLSVIGVEVGTEDVEQDDDGRQLTTARSTVILSLTPDDQSFLKRLRSEVFGFLIRIHHCLDRLVKPPTSNSGKYQSFSNSEPIRKGWIKLLKVTVSRRTAWLRNADDARKSLTMAKEFTYGKLAEQIKHDLSSIVGSQNFRAGDTDANSRHAKVPGISLSPSIASKNIISTRMADNICSIEYWKYHDTCTNNTVNRVWVLHAKRQHEYAILANKIHSKRGANPQLLSVFLCLLSLCSHEYDVIRHTAIGAMSKLMSYYNLSSFMNSMLLPLVHKLSTPGTTYAQAVGILSMLKTNRVMSKICNEWKYTEPFLTVLLATPAMVASPVVELEKKERLMMALGEVVVQFSKNFNHIPLSDSDVEDNAAQRLFRMALSTLGFDSATGQTVVSSTVSGGLRYDTYAGYIILHLTGHSDVTAKKGVWVWAMRTMLTLRGQPTLFVAWSALVRLCYIAFMKDTDGSFAPLIYEMLLKDIEKDTSSGSTNWVQFLQGLSSCSGSSSGEGASAQWSRGIIEVLHSAEFLRATFPRKLFPSKAEPSYSSHVTKENVGMFLSLFSYLHRSSSQIGAGNGFCFLSKSLVSKILAQSKELKSSSEDDLRQNNAVRAALWAGLYRTIISTNFANENDQLELESIAAQFFVEQVDKISADYCADWAEALMLALVGCFPKKIASQCKLIQYIMDSFENVLLDQSNVSNITATSETSAADDGFSRIDNRLALTESLLQAELSTDYHLRSSLDSSQTAIIGNRILKYLKQPHISLISQYRSTREHLATIVVILSQLDFANRTPLDELWSKLSVTDLSSEVPSDAAAMQVDGNSTTTAASMDDLMLSSMVTQVSSIEATDGNKDKAQHQTRAQHVLQFACHCLRYFAYESAANIEWVVSDIIKLLSLTIVGSGHSDIETAKLCHQTCIFVCITLKSFAAFVGTKIPDSCSTNGAFTSSLTPLVEVLKSHAGNASFHVRETVLLCSSIVMTNSWFTLTVNDKKMLKDVIAEGLVDAKPEVQFIAMSGMVAYLTAKPVKEIATIAEAYTRNSDILSVRERKKKKLGAQDKDEKVDKSYMANVMMVACLILTFPYDMPTFLPALVTSFVKHKSTSAVQATVLKVIQNFKRTHQDRWEDFKLMFTHEQLEDIQGAGAAHYFS